jgi:hypothetical protein
VRDDRNARNGAHAALKGPRAAHDVIMEIRPAIRKPPNGGIRSYSKITGRITRSGATACHSPPAPPIHEQPHRRVSPSARPWA